jgi:hypothetical protein
LQIAFSAATGPNCFFDEVVVRFTKNLRTELRQNGPALQSVINRLGRNLIPISLVVFWFAVLGHIRAS